MDRLVDKGEPPHVGKAWTEKDVSSKNVVNDLLEKITSNLNKVDTLDKAHMEYGVTDVGAGKEKWASNIPDRNVVSYKTKLKRDFITALLKSHEILPQDYEVNDSEILAHFLSEQGWESNRVYIFLNIKLSGPWFSKKLVRITADTRKQDDKIVTEPHVWGYVFEKGFDKSVISGQIDNIVSTSIMSSLVGNFETSISN